MEEEKEKRDVRGEGLSKTIVLIKMKEIPCPLFKNCSLTNVVITPSLSFVFTAEFVILI